MKSLLWLGVSALLSCATPLLAAETTETMKSNPVKSVFFSSTAETGDLSEWVGDGGGHVFSFAREDWKSLKTQGVQASTEQAHTGKYSIRCCLPDPRKGGDAKLYRERIGQPEAYYSAWFWFDKGFKPTQWMNIFQWKTNGPARDKPDAFGLVDYCDPTFVLLFAHRPESNTSRLVLYHWPVGEKLLPGSKAGYEQANPKPVPHSQWVHVEGYYKVDPSEGEVIIWQDGDEIFHVKGVNTRDARADHPNDKPGTIMWGVGVYSSTGNAGPLLAYVDDILVTNYRVGRAHP